MPPRKAPVGNGSPPRTQPVRLQRDILLNLDTPPDSMDEQASSEADSRRETPSVDDSTGTAAGSSAPSATGSSSARPRGGRRRRNRDRNKAHIGDVKLPDAGIDRSLAGDKSLGGGGGPAADQKPVKLQITLNLNVELELKAKLDGDVCLSLVAENMKHTQGHPEEVEAGEEPDDEGNIDNQLFRMHVGDMRLKQEWVEQVSPSLTAAVMLCIALGGFVVGMLASQAMGVFPRLLCPGPSGI